MLCLLTFAAAVREFVGHVGQAASLSLDEERAKAVATYLAVALDKVADLDCSLTQWKPDAELCVHAFGRQALPMVWDFAEQVPYSGIGGSWQSQVSRTIEGLNDTWNVPHPATVLRGSATALPWGNSRAGSPTYFDAVITDPPYYDNVPYADISDFFYVWLKRTVGHLYPEHFATEGTPKKKEAVADAVRYGGDKDKARRAYEQMMAQSFAEAHRVLKPGGQMVVVYAHKTTLGWSTLVDALRRAGFTVTEAWPLDTEMKSRLRGMESAALASSIFLVARKRAVGRAASPTTENDRLAAGPTGSYESDVQPELQRIVRERVDTFWKMGITGADLLIACVGAGLRAFTRFARVEYANGEEVPAERFLAEVETVVLETILARLSKEVGRAASPTTTDRQAASPTSLSGVDPATRFYLLWRYTYRWAELDAGEAIVFANGTGVELDGPGSLSYGSRPLVKKKKGKYRLLDFTERGKNEKLGLPHDGRPAPLIDVLHRTLWLMENRPLELPGFLRESRVNRERMRLVAQALAGPVLKRGAGSLPDAVPGWQPGPHHELAALAKLTANWRAVVEDATLTPIEREARRTGQQTLEFDKEQGT